MNECSNQQTLGITVFAYTLEVRKSLFPFRTQVVFELQPLFDVVVTKEFMDDLCSVNLPSLSSNEIYMED